MKVLFATDSLRRGGKERQLAILFCSLDAGLEEKHVVTLRLDENNNYLGDYPGLQKQIRVIQKRGLIGQLQAYNRLLAELNPDLVYSWDVRTSLLSLILSRRHGFAFINGSIRHGIRLRRFSHLLRSLVCRLSPYVVANSKAGLRVNGIPSNGSSFVLYNGIESRFGTAFSHTEIVHRRNELFPDYRQDSGAKIFISVANLVPYKDYHTVLEALARVDYPFYYVIVGDGPNRARIKAQIDRLLLADKVLLLGRIENVEDYLNIADYLIHSSRGEGCSNAILEAMFAGLPVIATNVGGTPEIVFEKSSALFPFGDVEELTVILKGIEHQFSSIDKDSAAYHAHLEGFTLDRMVKNFDQILDVIKGRAVY